MRKHVFKCLCWLSGSLLWLAGCAAPLHHQGLSAHHPGTEVPPGQVALRRIHADVWVHVSTKRFSKDSIFPMNGMIVRDGQGLLLVDTAWGEPATEALLAAIDREIGLPVRRAVVTHFHDDRLSGTGVLEARGIEVFATQQTIALAKAEGNAIPSSVLTELAQPGSTMTFGPVEIFYPGPGHARDNLVVYVPEAGILFGGCAVHEMARQGPGNIADADLEAWPSSLRRVKARYGDAKTIIPGHGLPGGLELLDHSIEVIERYQASHAP